MDKLLKENIDFANSIGDSFIEFGKKVKEVSNKATSRSQLYNHLTELEEELKILIIEGTPQLMGKMLHEDDLIKGKYN